MRRFFVKNLLFVVIVNVLIKPVWVLLIDRNVQNAVGQAVYGPYLQLINLSLIFQILLDFGITNYNNRTIAQQPDKLQKLFPEMFSARLALMILYIIVSCLVALLSGYTGWTLVLLTGILIFQALNMLVQFIRSNVSALHKFKTDSILSISDRLLMIVVCGFLLLYPATAHHFKIEWYIEAQIFCYLFAAIISYFVLRSIKPVQIKFSLHLPTLYSIMKETFPYALLIFLMTVYTRYDALMIGKLCGKDGAVQTGVYAEAYRLLDASNMFGLMFASILLPLFGRMLMQHENIKPIIRVSVNILLPGSLIVAVVAAYFGYPIMHRLYPAATAYDGLVFSWLMASFPAFCMMYVYSTLLTANGNLKLLNKQAAFGVFLNLSLNLYLIPKYQALGAAVAACITQGTFAILSIVSCTRVLHLPKNIKWLAAHLGFLLLIVVIGYCISLAPITNWVFRLGIFSVLSLMAMFIFRFISIGAIKQLLSKETVD